MPSKMLSTSTALLLWLFQAPYIWQSVTATAKATAVDEIQKERESPFSIVRILERQKSSMEKNNYLCLYLLFICIFLSHTLSLLFEFILFDRLLTEVPLVLACTYSSL